MSAKNKVQYSDPRGSIIEVPTVGIILAVVTTVPADTTPGYAPGCFLIDRDAAAGAQAWINEGTKASSLFKALLSTAEVGGVNLSTLVATAAELNTLHTQTLATPAPAGFTGGTGTVYKNSVQLSGGIYYTTILFDITGLGSSTTDLDIIGQGAAAAAHMGQITAAQNGTILAGQLTCLEVPVTGVTDIDLYWGTVGTGKFDDAVSSVTGTALVTAGGAWTLNLSKAIADPVGIANGYLYLCNGTLGTVGTYTAGKFRLDLFGT